MHHVPKITGGGMSESIAILLIPVPSDRLISSSDDVGVQYRWAWPATPTHGVASSRSVRCGPLAAPSSLHRRPSHMNNGRRCVQINEPELLRRTHL